MLFYVVIMEEKSVTLNYLMIQKNTKIYGIFMRIVSEMNVENIESGDDRV